MEQTAGQSCSSNLFCTEFRPADKKSSCPQMKLAHFKSNHNLFIMYSKGQNYMIIILIKIKVWL